MLAEIGQAVVSGLLIGAVYALVATGLTLIFGVMRFVNFAHGEFLMLSMYATFFAWSLLGLDPLVSIPLVASAIALLSVVTYLVCIRPLLQGTLFSQLIVTFGLFIFLRGCAQWFFTADTRAVVAPLIEPVQLSAFGVVARGPQLAAGAGAVVALTLLWWFLYRTDFGVAVRAVAQDAQAAELMGIQPARIHVVTWAIAGALVGVAGGLLSNFYPVTPLVGLLFGMPAFVTVALGGLGSMGGALVAALLIGLAQTLVGLAFPAYGVLAIFVLYFVVIQLRPQGLLGSHL